MQSFGGTAQQVDNTLTVYTSSSGSAGSKVSMHKSVLLSALTFNTETLGTELMLMQGIVQVETERKPLLSL